MIRALTLLLALSALPVAVSAQATSGKDEHFRSCQNEQRGPVLSSSALELGTGEGKYADLVGVFAGYVDLGERGVMCTTLVINTVASNGTWEGTFASGPWERFEHYSESMRRMDLCENDTVCFKYGRSGADYSLRRSDEGLTGDVRSKYPVHLRRAAAR